MRTGPRNLITDVEGLLVGNSGGEPLKSGVTCLTAEQPFGAAVDIRGGAPGTRETPLLDPDKLVDQVDAIVLSGGSAFGLDAAGGVMDALRAEDRGWPIGSTRVPIVPAAILFDLMNGGQKDWAENPYPQLGADAFRAATPEFELGTAGAGIGATTGRVKGGLGSASCQLESGHTVGALVAVNAVGSPLVPGCRSFWSWADEIGAEYGGLGPPDSMPDALGPEDLKSAAQLRSWANTTIAIVATDAVLDKAGLRRLATAAHAGLARAIVPAHTPLDGDLVFSVSTARREMDNPVSDALHLGHAAATTLARAIARGVWHAASAPGDRVEPYRG